MLSPEQLSKLSQQVLQALPAMTDDLRKHLHAALLTNLQRLDLVTREEFEVQTRLLERSREKLTQLERQIAELERHVLNK